MGGWRPGKRAPIVALLLQCLLTLFIVGAITTRHGHEAVISGLNEVNKGLARADEVVEEYVPNREIGQIQFARTWEPEKAFDNLVAHTAPVFWTFFLLTGLSLFLLRERDAGIDRPYSVPFYPLTPLLFCLSCGWMLYRAVIFVEWHCLFAIVLVLLGLPLYWLSSLINRPTLDGPVERGW